MCPLVAGRILLELTFISSLTFLESHLPVRDCFDVRRFLRFPLNTTSPPFDPGFGPISIILSAARMTFSSCSTTHTQYPASASFLNILIKLPTSLPCNPIVGSSNANIASVSEEPRQVVRLTLCVSPPLSVLVERSRVKYPSPTSCR